MAIALAVLFGIVVGAVAVLLWAMKAAPPIRFIFVICALLCFHQSWAQSNQAFPQKQYYASDYGTWQVKGAAPNTYQWQPASLCQFPQPAGGTFNAFNQNGPVLLADTDAANSELLTPAFVLINETLCEVALTPARNHYSFTLQSGTAGLQEALNTISGMIPYPTQVILDRNWYAALSAVPGQTASTVIASVKGSTAALLEDVTQAPTQFYQWNGSTYVAVAPAGASIPATGGILQTSGHAGQANASQAITPTTVAASTSVVTPLFALTNPGVFSNTVNNFPNLSAVNGCNLGALFIDVQYTATLTSAVNGCAAGPTNSPGTAYNQTSGGFFAATASGIGSGTGVSRAVGVNAYSIITGNNTEGYGFNPVVQDFNDGATGQSLIGGEIDTQPQKAASAYANNGFNVLGLHFVLYNQPGQGGIFGPTLFVNATNYGTPAYWGEIIDVAAGSVCPSGSCPILNINAFTDPATSGNNYGSPSLAFMYETYWTGSASAHASWRGPQAVIASGTNPMADALVWSHAAGPAGMVSSFELANGIQLKLDGSTSGSTVLSASATGSTLNLGSTNATVDSNGNLNVTTCTGCGGGVPTLYSGSVTYQAGAQAFDGSGNNYSSLSSGNVGNALTNATFWHFLGGPSSTITGGNCVTAGQVMNGISTVGVPVCAVAVPRTSLTFTSSTTDTATVTGVLSTSLCGATATNATAATNFATTYVSAISANSVTVTHVTGASGGTVSLVCSPN